METQLINTSHIIQLAVAPVFLLAGVGTKLTVLTNRLGRIIDRSRDLQDRTKTAPDADREEIEDELKILSRRARLINRAITLSTACGLLICLVIASLFICASFNLDFSRAISLLFVVSMFALIGSFIFFLGEIFVAINSMSRLGIVEK